MNIAEIEMQLSDLVNEPFDPSEFVFQFIEIFNPPKATLTKLRKAKPAPDNELLWPRKLHYQTAESGQSAQVVDVLKEQKMPKNKTPRFIIATDGKEFSRLIPRQMNHCIVILQSSMTILIISFLLRVSINIKQWTRIPPILRPPVVWQNSMMRLFAITLIGTHRKSGMLSTNL